MRSRRPRTAGPEAIKVEEGGPINNANNAPNGEDLRAARIVTYRAGRAGTPALPHRWTEPELVLAFDASGSQPTPPCTQLDRSFEVGIGAVPLGESPEQVPDAVSAWRVVASITRAGGAHQQRDAVDESSMPGRDWRPARRRDCAPVSSCNTAWRNGTRWSDARSVTCQRCVITGGRAGTAALLPPGCRPRPDRVTALPVGFYGTGCGGAGCDGDVGLVPNVSHGPRQCPIRARRRAAWACYKTYWRSPAGCRHARVPVAVRRGRQPLLDAPSSAATRPRSPYLTARAPGQQRRLCGQHPQADLPCRAGCGRRCSRVPATDDACHLGELRRRRLINGRAHEEESRPCSKGAVGTAHVGVILRRDIAVAPADPSELHTRP